MGLTVVADVVRWLDKFAPRELAESWDNVGLLMGDPDSPVSRVMTCLTVTPTTAQEAIESAADLIVTHHPIMFKPIQSLRADRPNTGYLWKLARAGIGVYSPHTAFDNCEQGINAGLARALSLVDVGPLRPSYRQPATKLIVFAPESDREPILKAAFEAGAGRIGNYEMCSFTSSGVGSFFGGEGSNPAIGQAGQFEEVLEVRLELICPTERVPEVVAGVRRNATYEEVAIDVIPLNPLPSGPGIGRLGILPNPLPLREFSQLVAMLLKNRATQFVGPADRLIHKVAICCGAGDDFLSDAQHAGADVLLTGEARFHRALEAEASETALVIAGHHATERPGVELLALHMSDAFPDLKVFASEREADPLQSMA